MKLITKLITIVLYNRTIKYEGNLKITYYKIAVTGVSRAMNSI